MIEKFVQNNPEEKEKLKNMLFPNELDKKSEKNEESKKRLEDRDMDVLDEYFDFYDEFNGDEDWKEKMMFTSLFYFYLRKKGVDV